MSNVSEQGRQPRCVYCRGYIDRGDWRATKKEQHHYESYPTIKHYHLGCFEQFTRQEQDQLLAIAANSEVGDDVVEQLAYEIREHRKKTG